MKLHSRRFWLMTNGIYFEGEFLESLLRGPLRITQRQKLPSKCPFSIRIPVFLIQTVKSYEFLKIASIPILKIFTD